MNIELLIVDPQFDFCVADDGHGNKGALVVPGALEDMQRLAGKRGGRCLSRRNLPNPQKMEWRCGRGHRFWCSAGNMKSGYGCPFCSGFAGKDLAWLRAVARKRGGRCLATAYSGGKTKVRWECARKHTWEAMPAQIANRATWCPRCSGRIVTIEDLRALAR